MHKLQCTISRLLTDLDALRVSTAEVTDVSLPVFGVQIGDRAWTGTDAGSTACAGFTVNDDSCGPRVNRDSVYGAALHAGVVIALGAEVGYLQAREGHEDTYLAGLGPHPALMVHAAGKLAASAAAAVLIVSNNPDRTHDMIDDLGLKKFVVKRGGLAELSHALL